MKFKNWPLIYWTIFKNCFKLFNNHDTLTLGAALSYYTGFSLVPILMIVISVAGAILGPDAVQGEVKRQLLNIMAPSQAQQFEDMIKSAYKPGENMIATLIALVVLIIGATSVFIQLRTSLNVIWQIKDQAKQPILKFIKDRLFSFAMIAGLIFLLLVSLTIHTALEALMNYINQRNPGVSKVLLEGIDIIMSFALTSVLFAIVYKYMSDARLKWNSVLPGAIFTAIFFALGKYLIGLYLSKSTITSTYGAAASIVLVLAWVFYSSQILFFGAEFTRALSIEKGMLLDPSAVKMNTDPDVKKSGELAKS